VRGHGLKKILTVCEGGNVRSVGLAYALKSNGQDAVAASWRFNTKETLAMLYRWADFIVVMQPEMMEHIPNRYKPKLRCIDVGPDRFGSAFHPELQGIFQAHMLDWQARDFEL